MRCTAGGAIAPGNRLPQGMLCEKAVHGINLSCSVLTVDVAQLVRASGCGPGGRGFESHHSPFQKRCVSKEAHRFCFLYFHVTDVIVFQHITESEANYHFVALTPSVAWLLPKKRKNLHMWISHTRIPHPIGSQKFISNGILAISHEIST